MKPILFVTGAGMTPVQASARNMDTHGSLLKWVQATATPGAAPVTSTRELESKCLKKERCALVMKAGPLEVGKGQETIGFLCVVALWYCVLFWPLISAIPDVSHLLLSFFLAVRTTASGYRVR